MEKTALDSILQVTVFGPLVIIMGLVIRYLFNRLLESYREKEAILRETLTNNNENIATLKRAMEIFEAARAERSNNK